ncbi:MAG: class I SAM-dependent methyltransferase [Thermoplasmata archaeon]|nr:class I SAM-dependent methyltransferase [Thermoplasmata archaeon]
MKAVAPGRHAKKAARRSDDLGRASDAVQKNRRFWQRISDSYEGSHESTLGKDDGRAWGFWRTPERDLRILGPVRGRRVLELGCGAARWSIGLRRHGAHPVGLDVSSAHLRHAARSIRQARLRFPLLVGDAERLPLQDESFDVVFCDWGAMTFCDPYRSVPEAARVLRPGGIFAFSTSSPFRFVCHDVRTDRIGRRLRHDYFDQHRVDFPDAVDYTLPYGEWIRLFRENGLVVERLIEPRGGPNRPTTYLSQSEKAWSAHFPLEAIWALRKEATDRRRRTGTGRKAHARPRPGRRHA